MVYGGPEYVRRSAPFFFWGNSRRNSQLPGMYCHKTMGSLVVKMIERPRLRAKCGNCPDIWYNAGTCNGCHVGENSCEAEPECLKEDLDAKGV